MKNRKIVRPQEPSHLREDTLADLYETPDFLPPLWRVIYQEAMRGHDILFPLVSPSDDITLGELDSNDDSHISDISCQIMAASDLSEMRVLIKRLQPTQVNTLRRILRCTFHRWQHSHRQSLN